MKVSFILLAHEAPEQLKGLICSLLAAGSNVYLHHDASSKGDMHSASAGWGLDALPGKLYLAERVKVVWGEWSIIEATLNCIKQIHKHDTDSDYFMLISGSCMPVKPVALLQQHLAESGKDHIEVVNAEKHQWVTAGLQKQRWSKFHFFNWRYQEYLFDTSLKIQRKLKIKRVIPLKHTAHMGSQWWCLRRSTLLAVSNLINNKPVLRRFYKRTWVPDELFFQTLVANLVPENEISSELLTRYKFNSWGIPRVYYNDDYPELLAEARFFVRKVSHRATELRNKLATIAPMAVDEFSRLLANSTNERNALLEKRELKQHIEANRWHSLESHQENKYDYIKSIPNPMVVLVGEDSLAKRNALAQLDRLEDTVVYGDLFSPSEVGKGYQHTGYLGIGRDAVKLAGHTWHQVLGDIAYQSPGKTLVFSLGSNFKDYLEVLRWKNGLNVILIDNHEHQTLSLNTFKDLYLKSQVLHFLRDRNCELSRLSCEDLKTWIAHCVNKPDAMDYIRWHLHKQHEQPQWPGLLTDTHDHWEFVKQLNVNMVAFVTSTPELPSLVKKKIESHIQSTIHENVFSVISSKDHTLDWHYYLADVVALNKKASSSNTLAIWLPHEQLGRLDTLRWKNSMDVIYLDVKENAGKPEEESFSLKGNLSLINKQPSNSIRLRLRQLLEDRHCNYHEIPAGYDEILVDALKKYAPKTKPEKSKKLTMKEYV